MRKHAPPLRSFDPLIVETLVEVMNAEGPQLHTHAIPKAVVKNADGSLTPNWKMAAARPWTA